MTGDDKYSILNRGILLQRIQMNLSQKQKKFYQLFCAFSKSTLIFLNFRAEMTLLAYVFPKLQTPEDVVR